MIALVKLDTPDEFLKDCPVYSMHRTISGANKAYLRERKESPKGTRFTLIRDVKYGTFSIPRNTIPQA